MSYPALLQGPSPQFVLMFHQRTVIALVPWLSSFWIDQFKKGGPGGELIWIKSINATLRHMGWELTAIGDFDQLEGMLKPYRKELDQITGTGEEAARKRLAVKEKAPVLFIGQFMYKAAIEHFGTPVVKDFEAFVLAAFGISPRDHLGLPSEKALTFFPQHFINPSTGLHVHSSKFDACLARKKESAHTRKKLKGLLWGKEPRYFAGKKALFERIAKELPSRLSLSKPIPLEIELVIAVDSSKDWSDFGGYDAVIPSSVTNIGTQNAAGWAELLCDSHFMVGLGDPYAGTSPVEMLALGGLYFNPFFEKPLYLHGDRNLVAMNQHPYLAALDVSPVCQYELKDFSTVDECVGRAVATFLEGVGTASDLNGQAAVTKDEMLAVVDRFSIEATAKRMKEILGIGGVH
ncbi:hypothetical protein HK101_002793 [Irineochytrium annulatum]|nr:hypothetical protein HK101_002793 [Irineochytrium annulatum]